MSGLGQAGYYRLISVNSGKCVSVTAEVSGDKLVDGKPPEGQPTGNDQPLIQSPCDLSAPDQKFYVAAFGDGYQLISRPSGRCVAVQQDGNYSPVSDDNTPVVQYDCSGDDDQTWKLQPFDGAYRLIALHSGKCMSVAGASLDDKAPLVQTTCTGGQAERFGLELFDAALASTADLGDRVYRFVSALSDKCAVAAATPNDAPVVQARCGGDANEQWRLQVSGEGYRAVAQSSGECLDALDAAIVQNACNGGESQRWLLVPVADGYQVVARHSDRCLRTSSTSGGAALVQSSCDASAGERWFLREVTAPAAQIGQWGAKIRFPLVPVAAALLPDGRVLTWSSWDRYDFVFGNGDRNKTYAATYDPLPNAVASISGPVDHDMFCPGISMLSDGRVFVNGGGPAVRTTSIFDFRSDAWSRDADMNESRWYNASVALADGGVFTIGGNLMSGEDGTGEVWHPDLGWSMVSNAVLGPVETGVPASHAEEYVRMNVAPDGRVFVSGPTPNMQWYSVTGSGAIEPAGARGDDETSQFGVYAMFGVGKILKAGGNVNIDLDLDAVDSPSNGNAYVIDINGAAARVERVDAMHFARTFANGVVLPDGRVLVIGGRGNGQQFSDEVSALIPEMFDPGTKTWAEMAPLPTPRNYHSVALLLPDGRVFAGGGGLCGTCNVNHPDAEIYSPPYLFRGARPSITSASGQVADVGGTYLNWTYGGASVVTTDESVARFTLVRLSSVTHSTNTDQRLIDLAFHTETADTATYAVTAPANAAIAPAGYYMLFALDATGVPSVAKMVKLGAPS